MLVSYHNETLDTNWSHEIIEKCCKKKPHEEDPPDGDCCSDSWKNELNDVKAKYNTAVEEAAQADASYTLIKERRDQLKLWWDELQKTDDKVKEICHQFEIIACQTKKIHINTKWAVEAIRILYCMIIDFYMQVDGLKVKYDRLRDCINCINHPALSPTHGIVLCIDNYGKQLDLVIGTRDQLIKLLMEIVELANQLWRNVDGEKGLEFVICAWHKEICQEKPKDNTEDKWCELKPILTFPISKDPYYEFVKGKLEADEKRVLELNQELLKANKKAASILACKDSLEKAIDKVKASERCK